MVIKRIAGGGDRGAMIGSPPAGERRRDDGFTLIELMVVVLIIAILIAIAVPTFMGVRRRAQDRAAQSNVRTALTAEKTFYTDRQAYTATAAELTAIESSLTYVDSSAALSPTGSIVYVKTFTTNVTDDTIVIGAKSASGTCFWLRDTGAFPGTHYLSNETCAPPDGTTAMNARW
jgi:type IV pilus assembly protein PilA